MDRKYSMCCSLVSKKSNTVVGEYQWYKRNKTLQGALLLLENKHFCGNSNSN